MPWLLELLSSVWEVPCAVIFSNVIIKRTALKAAFAFVHLVMTALILGPKFCNALTKINMYISGDHQSQHYPITIRLFTGLFIFKLNESIAQTVTSFIVPNNVSRCYCPKLCKYRTEVLIFSHWIQLVNKLHIIWRFYLGLRNTS